MTNDIFCVGLTRTELQTLGVLLPITFRIIPVSLEALDHAAVVRVIDQARCIILNPKRLSVDLLDDFLRGQDYQRRNDAPVPIILFSDTMAREPRREVFIPEYPILSVDLHERFDRNRNLAVKLLRESTLPCWQNREVMRSNMFNDAWYLLDIETTGLDRWKDRIIAIRVARMANYEINWERPTIYIRQAEPLPAQISEITGITDNMLAGGVSMEEALEELDSLPCKDTPFLFANEDFATGFLNAEYLRCGKTFDRPYVAIDKLANIPFGYLMQRKAWNIPSLIAPELTENACFDTELQSLYALTKCTFEALLARYDVHCPGQFDKLYAADITDV